MQYTGTAVQQVQQQYSRFAVLVQQYSQYSCQRIGQRPVYCSTAVQHSTAVQQYSSSTAVQQTAGAQTASLSIDNSIDNTFEGIEDIAPRTSQNICFQPAERSSEDSEPF